MFKRGNALAATFAVLAVLAAVHVSTIHGQVVNRCPPSGLTYFSYGHPENCKIFYICVWGSPFQFTCPSTTHFNEKLQVCVHAYSPEDECARRNAEAVCAAGVYQGLIGHPTDCQRYYDCSDTSIRPSTSRLGPYEKVCPGSELFDLQAAQCVPYNPDVCGDRVSPPVKDGSCYSLTMVKNNYFDSQAECQQNGGNLAEIETSEEDDVIKAFLDDQDISETYVFIGADDLEVEGEFKWQISTANFDDYTRWGRNQPNDQSNNEDCLAMANNNDWDWFDRPCSQITYGVCEIPI